MNKICTSIEQSKKLIELGIDVNTADMWYTHIGWEHLNDNSEAPIYFPIVIRDCESKDDIPCWSLSALLDVMQEPELIKNSNGTWLIRVWYNRYPWSRGGYNNPVDACYDMILKLHEQKLL